MKRLFLPLMLALLTLAQASAYTFEVDGIYYNKNGTNATVTFRDNNYNSYSGEVIIPDTVTYDGIAYPVTAIGDGAFQNSAGLTAVTIPSAVTSIGSNAFYGCTSLDGIVIPEGLTKINERTFQNCSSLSAINIPADVTSIGYNAFANCNALTSLVWDAVNCNSRGEMTTANIEQVTIGDGVTLLPEYFLFESNITEVSIPASVMTIGSYAFGWCTELQEVYIPDSITVINEHTFGACLGLKSVHLPAALTEIKRSGFERCPSLNEIVIPAGVTKLGDYVFNQCNSLTAINIPAGVTSIGYNAFANCNALKSLEWNAVNCNSLGNMTTANIEHVTIGEGVTRLPSYFVFESNITEVSIPASVKTIGSYAFGWCTELQEVYIPDSITVINEHTFGACLGLKSAHLPAALTEIKRSGFERCPSLKEIVIPAGVTKLGDYVFYNCDSLTSLTVRAIEPPTVSGSTTFSTLYNIAKLRVPRGVIEDYKAANYWKNFLTIVSDEYDFEVDGIYYVKTGDNTASVTYKDTDYNTYSGAISIPKQVDYEGVTYRVTGISFEAFKDCPDLTKVTMSKRIKSIGYNAFENCTSLTKVTIPDNVTAIGAGAFKGCTALTDATIGSSVATIGAQAFDGCDALTTVMSRSVTPPTLAGRDCFNCYETATLKVPIAAVEDYSSADYWKEFMQIVGVEINAGLGDVDGDGNIGISDVTTLIDFILGGGGTSFYEENADFDENGNIGISDATALIDYILSGGDD